MEDIPHHPRRKSSTTLKAIFNVITRLNESKIDATFNKIKDELLSHGIISNQTSLRHYLDLLVASGIVHVEHFKTKQRNIRPKHLYEATMTKKPMVESGFQALLFHGLNWDIGRVRRFISETDFEGLARATIENNTLYASLEDSIVATLEYYRRRKAEISFAETFAVALLATQRADLHYLIIRAKQRGVLEYVLATLLKIEKTLSASFVDVEDIKTLYSLRSVYAKLRRPPIERFVQSRSLSKTVEKAKRLSDELLTSNEVIEYAGKQLGISG